MKLHSFLTILIALFAVATITVSAQDMPEHHDNAKAEPCCEKEMTPAENSEGHECTGDCENCDGNCSHDKAEGTETSAVDKAEIFNAYCPIRGGEVDPEVETVEYNGKVYGFCCPGCDTKFKEDPEKWSKNISPCGKKFIGEKS